MEMMCLRSMCGFTHMDPVRNEKLQRRTGTVKELVDHTVQEMLRWFRHVGGTEKEHLCSEEDKGN